MTDKPQVLTVEEALERSLDLVQVLESETVPFMEAMGRVIAEDVRSDIDVSPFDNSAMDGFAVRAADIASATTDAPVELDVIEDIPAGAAPRLTVESGQAARIMTGAAMPEGADTVVKIESTSAKDAGGMVGEKVGILGPEKEGANVRYKGEEVAAGDVVVARGDNVNAATIGLFAATGNVEVSVYRRPRVAIIATGSELVDVTDTPGPGKIRNSNSYAIAAQVADAGGEPVIFPVVIDELEPTREAFVKAAAECDLIITSGGVSVGDHDHVKPVLEELGEVNFWKVFMRPGNPQTLGIIDGVPLFGLPGNPSSCYVGFEVFIRPMLRKMQGFVNVNRPKMRAVLATDQNKKQDRRYYLRGRVRADGEGGYIAELTGSQSSALLTAAHEGNALLILPEGIAPIAAGTTIDCLMLDRSPDAV